MTALADLQLLSSGKVRELYDLGDELLMVASDRISTYDVVHPTPIPDKGRVLTAMSVFFFDELDFPNHLAGPADDVVVAAEAADPSAAARRRCHVRLGATSG